MFHFEVPTPSGLETVTVEKGTSTFFVGANGAGKTRMAISIENTVGETAHRIAAQRTLQLNPEVPKIAQENARRGLKFGHEGVNANFSYRSGHRWQGSAETAQLNDYDKVVQLLFAEQSNVALKSHKALRDGDTSQPAKTKFERLIDIWDKVLPHRRLEVTGDNIEVLIPDSLDKYSARNMSDGERAVFYLIAQTLSADADNLLIFDEPELHVHRSILARLWDSLEAARPDCAMVVITHDLEFAASRQGKKFYVSAYTPSKGWTIEAVPENSGFSEETTTLILGSRKPVLFVEGTSNSLDLAVYRSVFPGWTVIPAGACEQVVHSVTSMRTHVQLTRVTCAGIVDADSYTAEEVASLEAKGIGVLPVSEIENIFLLPTALSSILASQSFDGDELIAKQKEIDNQVFAFASEPKNSIDCVLRYCRRRIDRTLKRVDLGNAKDAEELSVHYQKQTSSVDVVDLATAAQEAIKNAITQRNLSELLKWFDNKGLMTIAATSKGMKKSDFEQWIVRSLNNRSLPSLSDAIEAILPKPSTQVT